MHCVCRGNKPTSVITANRMGEIRTVTVIDPTIYGVALKAQ